MTPKPLHGDTPKSDPKLEEEAALHLSNSPPLQLMTELYTRLRDLALPWWTPEHLRAAHPAAERMKWFSTRPDLRQKITTQLTGLAPKAARNKTPEFQADLIDSVIDSGDITVDVFERVFDPSDIMIYGPASEIWKLFRRRMPWDDDRTTHQDVIGWFLGALIADKSTLDGKARTPVLTALALRTAIDGRVWHSRIPLDVRVEIDNARFQALKDRPNEPFTPAQDLLIATPALIAASLPLKELHTVMDRAGVALGFETGSTPSTPGPSSTVTSVKERVEVSPATQKTASIPPAAASPARTPSIPPRASTPPPGALQAQVKEAAAKEPAKEGGAKDAGAAKPPAGQEALTLDSAIPEEWTVSKNIPKPATISVPPVAATSASTPPPKPTPTKADEAPKDRGSKDTSKDRGGAQTPSTRAPAWVDPQAVSAARHDRFDDPPTSDDKDEKDDKKDVDELEHTNPWAVPSGLPEPGGSSDTPRQPKADKKRD